MLLMLIMLKNYKILGLANFVATITHTDKCTSLRDLTQSHDLTQNNSSAITLMLKYSHLRIFMRTRYKGVYMHLCIYNK